MLSMQSNILDLYFSGDTISLLERLEIFLASSPNIKSIITPVLTSIVTAFIFQYYLIHNKQKKEKLNDELSKFHEKYFKLMDQLLETRLKLVKSFDKCNSSYESLSLILNDEINIRKIDYQKKAIDYFSEFKEDRKVFLECKSNYIKNVATFHNLFFEEHRVFKNNLNNRKAFEQLINWLYSANHELKDCFNFLDELATASTQVKNDHYSNAFKGFKIDKYFKDAIEQSIDHSVSTEDVKKNLVKITQCSFVRWYFRKRIINRIPLEEYENTKMIFDEELKTNKIDHNFRPFWINKEQFVKLENIKYHASANSYYHENLSKTQN